MNAMRKVKENGLSLFCWKLGKSLAELLRKFAPTTIVPVFDVDGCNKATDRQIDNNMMTNFKSTI